MRDYLYPNEGTAPTKDFCRPYLLASSKHTVSTRAVRENETYSGNKALRSTGMYETRDGCCKINKYILRLPAR